MKRKTKIGGFLRDSLIVFGLSIAILVSAELVLRVIFPEKIGNFTFEYEFNEDYLVALKPNITRTFVRKKTNGGDVIRWRTNKDRFRGPELKENPGFRIIVYGDSNIQARFSERADTFPAQLAHYLNRQGMADVEVINAGVRGFGPDQSLIRFTKEADVYAPDLVVFHLYADNDFGDIIRNRLFDLDADGNLSRIHHQETIDAHLNMFKLRGSRLRATLSQLLIVKAGTELLVRAGRKPGRSIGTKSNGTASNAPYGIRDVHYFNQVRKGNERQYLAYMGIISRTSRFLDDHYDADIALGPEQESSKTKIRLMEGVLKQAHRVAREKGIGFLVLIQPSVVDLTAENFLIGYKLLQRYPGYRQTNLTDAVENICALHHIPYLNLFDLFRDNNPEDLFFRSWNDHWNDSGQKLAAREAARYLIRNRMIGE